MLAPFWRKTHRNGSRKDWTVTWSSLVPVASAEHHSSYVRAGSVIAERFKFIRGSLLMSNPGGPPKVVLVTGPDKNAGKTFVACNLASSLTELNKKVLIIDADLRNPQVHRVFGVDNDTGLSTILTGQSNGKHTGIVSTAIPNVFLLPAGPASPTPSELLASTQMEGVLERCSRDFDFVLLDSAPLLPVFDSHVLTTRCDASLLVVRSGETSYRDVNASLEAIARVGGKVSGVVLNAVDLDDYAQNYYYGYQTYNYGSESREIADDPARTLTAGEG
jgi:capsular exopolysaccharide synthesis family protein